MHREVLQSVGEPLLIYTAKILAVLLILATAYLFGAFVNWEANPADWTGIDRLMLAGVALYFLSREFTDRVSKK